MRTILRFGLFFAALAFAWALRDGGLVGPGRVFAQDIGILSPGDVMGVGIVTPSAPTDTPITSVIDQGVCGVNGDFPVRSAGVWGCGTPGTGLAISGSALNLQPSQAATIGGVKSITCAIHTWINTISGAGAPSCTQPAFSDISGTVAANQGGAGTVNGALKADGSGNVSQANCASLSDGATGCSTAYVQGTWTPTLSTTGTVGTPAYAFQVGTYEHIGRQVTVRFNLQITGWTGSPTGNVTVTGLPFTNVNNANEWGHCLISNYIVTGLAASNFGMNAIIQPNTAIASLQQNGSTATNTVTVAQFGTANGNQVFGVCWYHT